MRPRLLVTSAEPLDDVLRRQLTADGDLEIRNFYGSVESGRIGWECAAGEGLHVGFTSFLRGLEDLRQFRVVQPAVDRLVLELRFAAPPAPAALDTLREQVARHLGEPMRIDVERVEAFDEGPGKFRTFVSHVGGRG